VPNEAGGYDTHRLATPTQAQNLFYSLEALSEIINAPGESDPKKLELDRTLIVISTEFGRTPGEEGARGRGHWPFGYPTLLIGGPVRPDPRSVDNGGIFGAIAESGHATTAVTPTEVRAGLMLAMGIWPFANVSFNVSDVAGAASEAMASALLREKLYGI